METKPTSIFKAKTQEGHMIKILAELLQHNIKTGCFMVNEKSIHLRMMDTHRKILIDLELLAENFSIYKFKHHEPLNIGLNLSHFHRMLKSIKKKDSLVLYIKSDDLNNLYIKVIPKENNRISTSIIKIQNTQNIEITLPDNYSKPIIVPSTEYQKMCKEMNNIGNTINVKSKGFYIKFKCDAGGVYSREVLFGELEDTGDGDSSEEEEMISEYCQDFDSEQLSRIIKISGLSSHMQIYPKNDLPLLFKSCVGNLGKIMLFIKSKEQIELDILHEDLEGQDDSGNEDNVDSDDNEYSE